MTPSALKHAALPHSGGGGFAAAAAERAVAALESDAAAVVVAAGDQLAEVRENLGRDAAKVITVDRSVVGRNPARLIPTLQQVVAANPGRAVRAVAETVRGDDSAECRAELGLHERMLQLPRFRAWNCSIICAYDQSLPPEVIDEIQSWHVSLRDPEDAVDRVRAQPLPPRPAGSEELGVDRTTLSALRGFVAARAANAGLSDERVDDLVYAVNEVVTNSICHGEGRAWVSFWVRDGTVTCEVRDRGWIRDPLAGRVAPHPDSLSGRGLWLVNQLCDLVQLRSSPAGTTVRLLVDA